MLTVRSLNCDQFYSRLSLNILFPSNRLLTLLPSPGTIACSREVFLCELLGFFVKGKSGVAREVIKSRKISAFYLASSSCPEKYYVSNQ